MYSYVGDGSALPQTNEGRRRGRNEDALYGFAVAMLVSQLGFLTIC